MGFSDWFFLNEPSGRTEEKVTNAVAEATFTNEDILDQQFQSQVILSQQIWQKKYALSVVTRILTSLLVNVEWRTYSDDKNLIKKEEWFRFNYAPNKKQTAAEFYARIAEKLITVGSVLIVEFANGELFVADSYSYYGTQKTIKANSFSNVVIGDVMIKRIFKENTNCMLIEMPDLNGVKKVLDDMAYDFQKLKESVNKGVAKALGTKYNLETNMTGKEVNAADISKRLQENFVPLMDKDNAVFITYKGEQLADLTEKQRGNEVEQVVKAVSNNAAINAEIVNNIGGAYCIPSVFMTGKTTQDDSSSYNMLITFFAKPILKLLSQKFTLFALEKETIINGGKIKADLNSIAYANALGLSTAVDKLISSGAFSTNEVREKLDSEPIEGGDERVMTKNYALANEKGGEGE